MDESIFRFFLPITPEEERILRGEGIDRHFYNEDGKNVVQAKKLLSEGRTIAIRRHPRFVHFPLHTHDFVEVVYMLSGSTRHRINGKELILKEGELLFLGQGARQEIFPAGKNDLAVNFIILPPFFSKTLEMLGEEETPLRRFLLECLGKNGGPGMLHFRVRQVLPVQNLVENLLYTLVRGEEDKRLLRQSTMGLLFLELLRCTDRLFVSEEEDISLQAFSYIEEHYRDGSLSELAARLHLDLSALSRALRRRCGKTFTELLQEKRLSRSAFLLRNTDADIETIARSVGYENKSYFYRLFRARYGVSPRTYRLGK